MGLFSGKKSEVESKYYVLTLESNISDIESNISKGIYVKPMSLYEKDTSMVGKVNDMLNPFGSKGNSFLQKNVFGKDLLIEKDKVSIITENSSLFGKIGGLTGEGNLELYINNITSIKFREGSRSQNGYISFVFMGKQDRGTGWLDSLQKGTDPYQVLFPKSSNTVFNHVKNYIDSIIISNNSNKGQVVQQVDSTLQLEKLHELKEKGIITEEEFQEKKKSLLDKL